MRTSSKSKSNNLPENNEVEEKVKTEVPKDKPAVVLSATAPQLRVDAWGRIAKIAVCLLVFLAPLFFLPWTFNALDFNKQALTGLLVVVSLIAWIFKILVSAKIELNLSRLNIPILIMLLIYLLSSVFSLWSYGSFWGWPLNIGAGFITALYFVLLYFIIVNIFTPFRDKSLTGLNSQKGQEEEGIGKGIFPLLLALVFSGFLVALFGLLQIFEKFVLPWDFTKTASFNTIGTVNSLAVFLAVLVPLAVSLIFAAKKFMRTILFFFVIIMLLALVFINFWIAWAVLIAGSVILSVFGMANIKASQTSMHLLQFSLALLVIGFAFLFIIFTKTSVPGFPQTPIEVSLRHTAEIAIAKGSLQKAPFLGSGPGTFVYDFAKFKPGEVNQTFFWNVRFEAGASEVLDRLVTTGILGILSLISIFIVFLWKGLKSLTSFQKISDAQQKTSDLSSETGWLILVGAFASFTGSVLSQFLYPANFSLIFLFWILAAILVFFDRKRVKSWDITPASPLAVGASFVLVLVMVLSAGLFFIGTQKYVAEIRYLQGLKFWQASQLNENPSERSKLGDEAIKKLEEAIKLSPNIDIYWQNASQFYLMRLTDVLQRQDLPKEEINSQAQTFINGAVNSAKQSTDLNPENVANWNVRGFIYRNIIGVISGTSEWSLSAYKKAAELEPLNPYIFTEIGRVYLARFDAEEGDNEENLRLSRENFEKSIQIKNDYAPAHFQVAMTYVREGKIKTAAEKLEATKQVAPTDVGLAFQLGVLYYQDNQFEKAKAELERAVSLDQSYSNARYFLGLIYDREGNKETAILQFEKIEQLNPGNQEIKKILENLKSGKPALEGIQPSQPPIEEKPAEIEENQPEKK